MGTTILHETAARLRLRPPRGVAPVAARVALEMLDGIRRVRIVDQPPSLVVHYDGRRPTRDALLAVLDGLPAAAPPADALPRRAAEALPLPASLLAYAAMPLLPPPLRAPAALALVAGHGLAHWRSGVAPTALLLDGIAMATNALGGRPLTAGLSVLLTGIAERRRAQMLARSDQLLAQVARRGVVVGRRGDGAVAEALPPERAEQLRAHVQHALKSRDVPGVLTPDLERLLALPVTAAGLVLALTGDALRSAQMLQADPQLGIALAQPLAREAALYALVREGVLLNGLDGVDRLATATAFAFEDVGVLAEQRWTIDHVAVLTAGVAEADVRRWLARLAGGTPAALDGGLADEVVLDWRDHGAVLHEPPRVLHVAGAALLQRTWGLTLPEPDRSGLVRRLGLVHDGRLLALLHLGCPLRPGLAQQLQRLRDDGVGHIAVFSEDPTATPATALQDIGADTVVCASRAAQRAWLADAAQRGERVALVHTGLRELLPPGGLSLCPVHAEAGAHGVLLGEPLPSLLAARSLARRLRRTLRGRFGRAVAANATLMTVGALGWLPPWVSAATKYGLALLLLERSAALAELRAPPADDL